MLQLQTHEHVQIYVETIIALARDARAGRNKEALAFLGPYLTKLMPESALEAFRDELRRLPAQPTAIGANCAAANSNAVAELEAHIAERDKAHGVNNVAPNVNVEPKIMQARADTSGIEF